MIYKTPSFLQDQRHTTKTERFQPIKPDAVNEVLSRSGFNLVHLKTGRAKLEDRAAHQTTIARYRSETPFKIHGLNVDIVAKIPHLYGAIELFLGTYRQICSNGLTVGKKFEVVRIKHLGDAVGELERQLPRLVAQHNALYETISGFQGVILSDVEVYKFAESVASEVLKDVKADIVMVDKAELTRVRRGEDMENDLWTVLNVIQENITRHGLPYTTKTVDSKDNNVRYFHRTAKLRDENSPKALSINRTLWDIATDILERKAG